MEGVQPLLAPTYRDIAESYRKLASQCREMAKRDRRPGSLLLRAAAFDEIAARLEHARTQKAA